MHNDHHNIQAQGIHERFEEQVRATPHHVAVLDDRGQLSYAELNAQANQLAHYLRGLGIGPDSLVGLYLERGMPVMVAILGILKAGGAYLPLDPAYPEARLRYMVESSGLTLILSDTSLNFTEVQVVCPGDCAGQSAADPRKTEGQGSTNLAYVIYTSGSTGLPKGVMIEHRGALNLAQYQQRLFDVSADSRVICFASFSFDAATSEWLMALLKGATLCICGEVVRRDPAALEAYLLEQRITHATLPPALLAHLSHERPYSLQSLVLAGEACSLPLVQAWLARTRVFNAYGPTETTVCASAVQLRDGEPVSIGRAMDNFQLYVLDAEGGLLPHGQSGELYIGGVGLARGYLNRPDLTAERFVPNPFGAGRLYRSGDLVRHLDDGNLAFLGRIDDQVKIRGYRVELGEIEAQLLCCPGVESAVVLAREQRLVAYVTPAGTDGAALREQLQVSLPDYMVPALYVALDALPLTPNGKVDKHALPAPDALAIQDGYQPPSTPTERQLADIWAGLLHMDAASIGASANFFALGGHSLSIIALSVAIRERFGKQLRPGDMYVHTDIASLARKIDSLPDGADSTIASVGAQQTYAVSSKQKMDWMSNQISKAKQFPSLCCQLSMELDNTDVAVLERALQLMTERHEILRTTLRVIDGGLRQVVCGQPDFPVLSGVHDLRQEGDEAFAAIKRQENARCFDFATLPLFSAQLVRMRESDCLLFTVDHVCGDQQFFDTLLRELRLTYTSMLAGRMPQLPPVRLDYKSYAQWEHEQLNGPAAEAHRDYWHSLVGPGPYPNLCGTFADHAPPVIASYRASIAVQLAELGSDLDPLFYTDVYGSVVNAYPAPQQTARYLFPIDATLLAALQASGAASGAWLSCAVIAGLHILLHKLSGQARILMGIVAEGRITDQLADVGGCLINDIFSVSRIDAGMSCAGLMAQLQQQMQASAAHKIYPFARLLNELDVALDALGMLELNYVSAPGNVDMPALAAHHQLGGFGAMDINISMTAYRDGIHVECNYKSALFKPATIEAAMQYYLDILRQLANDPGQLIAEIPMIKSEGAIVFSTERTELDSAMRKTRVLERVAREDGILVKTVVKAGAAGKLVYRNPITLADETLRHEELDEFFRNRQRIVDDIATGIKHAAGQPEAPWRAAVRANRAEVERLFHLLQGAPAAPASVVSRTTHPAMKPILHVLPRLVNNDGDDSVLALIGASLPHLRTMGFSTLMLGCVDRQACDIHYGEDEHGKIHSYTNNHGYWCSGEPGIDPELGSEMDYVSLAQAAEANGVMLMQDTVLASMGYPAQLARLAQVAFDDPLRCLQLGERIVSVCDADAFLHDDCVPEEDGLDEQVSATLYADVVAQSHCGSLYALPKPNLFDPAVLEATLQRTLWQVRSAGVHAFRIDMAKHIGPRQLQTIIATLRAECDGRAMAVLLEYWTTRYRDLKFAMLGIAPQSEGVYFYDFPLAQALQDILLRDHDVREALAELLHQRAHWGINLYQMIPTFIDHDFSFRPIYNGDCTTRAMVVVGYALAAMLSANAPYVYFAYDKSCSALHGDEQFSRTTVSEIFASADQRSPADPIAALFRALEQHPEFSSEGGITVTGDVYSATITRSMADPAGGVVQAHFSRFYEPEPDAGDPSVIFAYCHGPSIVIRRIYPLTTTPPGTVR
jgi:amino acid adenylation domain-containing protein